MEVRNETSGDLTVGSFKGSDLVRAAEIDCHWPTAGQGAYGFNCPEKTCYIRAAKGKWTPIGNWTASAILVNGSYNKIYEFGPYTVADGSLVIVERNGDLVGADWYAIYAKWAGVDDTAKAQAASLLNATAISENILDALQSAFHDTPLFPIATFLVSIGRIVLIAQNADSQAGPPPPPNINEISDAIEALLKQELAEFGAREYATTFLQAAHWLHRWGGVSHSALWGFPTNNRNIELSPNDLKRFRHELEDLVNDMGGFQVKLNHIARNPSWGVFILPAFLVGVSANLHIRWLNDIVRFYDGTRITDRDVDEFRQNATDYRSAVDTTKKAFEVFVQKKVAATNLNGTSLDPMLTGLITKCYTGHSDLSFLKKPLSHIDRIIADASTDITNMRLNQPPQYYLKDLWRNSKKANDP